MKEASQKNCHEKKKSHGKTIREKLSWKNCHGKSIMVKTIMEKPLCKTIIEKLVFTHDLQCRIKTLWAPVLRIAWGIL